MKTSKAKKQDTNQLWLDFSTAADNLKSAVVQFEKAAKAILEAPAPAEQKIAALDESKQLRKLLNRKVRTLACVKFGKDFRAAYMALYEELRVRFGFNVYPLLASWKGAHVDALEKCGQLPNAIKAVNGLLG
jgi:hypothetical protein